MKNYINNLFYCFISPGIAAYIEGGGQNEKLKELFKFNKHKESKKKGKEEKVQDKDYQNKG